MWVATSVDKPIRRQFSREMSCYKNIQTSIIISSRERYHHRLQQYDIGSRGRYESQHQQSNGEHLYLYLRSNLGNVGLRGRLFATQYQLCHFISIPNLIQYSISVCEGDGSTNERRESAHISQSQLNPQSANISANKFQQSKHQSI